MSAHDHTHHDASHPKQHHGYDPDETLSSDEAHGGHHAHVTPFAPMLAVFIALIFLTFVTVGQSLIPTTIMSEFLHIAAAILIASLKAVLVAAYFMHLKYDRPMNTVVLGATVFAVILFLGLTMLDLHSRKIGDTRESGEIYTGGNMKLYAGSHTAEQKGETNPLVTKPDMNIVRAAQLKAEQGHGAPADEHAVPDATPAHDAPKDGDSVHNH